LRFSKELSCFPLFPVFGPKSQIETQDFSLPHLLFESVRKRMEMFSWKEKEKKFKIIKLRFISLSSVTIQEM
jgi:hypothetical protein